MDVDRRSLKVEMPDRQGLQWSHVLMDVDSIRYGAPPIMANSSFNGATS